MARAGARPRRRDIAPIGFEEGGTPAPVAPVLSAATAMDFSDVFVWGQATTDTASGTLYAVACLSAAAAPSAAQIEAGTDGADNPAPGVGNQAITSTGVKQILLRGLTAVTAYRVYMTHKVEATYSNVVNTASFTTDTLILAVMTNGTSTGLAAPGTGSAAYGLNEPGAKRELRPSPLATRSAPAHPTAPPCSPSGSQSSST